MTSPGAARILIADEAEESRNDLARYFSARGWDVLLAAGGLEALSQSLAQHFDAIVMNTSLPGFEGYETAAVLRRIFPRIPIILTVGPDADVRPHESEHRQVFRCFPKPLDLAAVARAVDEARAGIDVDVAGHEGDQR